MLDVLFSLHLIIWWACGIAAYGFFVAYAQRHNAWCYEPCMDRLIGLAFMFSGVVGLWVSYHRTEQWRYGWRL